MAFAEKCLRARACAAWPSVRRRVGSAIRLSMARASASASPDLTSSPVTLFSTTSGIPPTLRATLGHAKNIASRMLRQKLSDRSERIGIAGLDQQSGHVVLDHFRDSAHAPGDAWAREEHRFENAETKTF